MQGRAQHAARNARNTIELAERQVLALRLHAHLDLATWPLQLSFSRVYHGRHHSTNLTNSRRDQTRHEKRRRRAARTIAGKWCLKTRVARCTRLTHESCDYTCTYWATMVRFKNFECTINVGHVPLPEYTSPDDAADREGPIPTAIVYVQSEEGKAFSIRLKVLDDVGLYANSVDMYLSLDGATLKRIWNVEVHKHCFVRGFIYPNSEGRTMMREFLFSKLDVLEETRDPENNGDINSLGEITVSLRRYQRAGAVLPNPNNETKNPALPSIKSVPEKHLKGRDINQSVG
jgi:hypothetical protein